ncbi:hypothetical protein AHAS_Ahas13G0278200 [Arachis hypogaea]
MAPRGLLLRRHVQLAVAPHCRHCHQECQERQKELAGETTTARRSCAAITDEGEGSRGNGLGPRGRRCRRLSLPVPPFTPLSPNCMRC